jgi:hypothetical protein
LKTFYFLININIFDEMFHFFTLIFVYNIHSFILQYIMIVEHKKKQIDSIILKHKHIINEYQVLFKIVQEDKHMFQKLQTFINHQLSLYSQHRIYLNSLKKYFDTLSCITENKSIYYQYKECLLKLKQLDEKICILNEFST